MNRITIDMTHPNKLMLAMEFIAELERIVKFKVDLREAGKATLYLDVDDVTIHRMRYYIKANS